MTMDTTSPAALLALAKTSGRCPPSLIGQDRIIEGGAFELLMLRFLDRTSSQSGLVLGADSGVVQHFQAAMKMAEPSGLMGIVDARSKARALEQRRCILLATMGSTSEVSPTNPSLKIILSSGFLIRVKAWLDDILVGNVGGIDLLLHLLSNIRAFPVTKEMVTTSKLGKAVAALEKHKICVGSLNESSIKNRVGQVKERWSASVKAMKNSNINSSTKRPSNGDMPPVAKKIKKETPSSSFSNLLKKVDSMNGKTVMTGESARSKTQERDSKMKGRLITATSKSDGKEAISGSKDVGAKNDRKHIRWADNNGKALAVTQEKEGLASLKDLDSEKSRQNPPSGSTRPSWLDRKKKDLFHEKELLLQARKTSSVDNDDKQDMLNAMAMMVVPWKSPHPLPEDKENPPVQIASNELTAQANRMRMTQAVRFMSEADVPNDPVPLTEGERAPELSSRITSIPGTIPFFTPQETANIPQNDMILNTLNQTNVAPPYAPPTPPSDIATSSEATLETVLMMGLPLFLVGSNLQALQTLAATPNLLKTFRDANGVYDQPRLMNLVQTLTQNLMPAQINQPQNQMLGYNVVGALQNDQSYYQQSPASFNLQPNQSFGVQSTYASQSLHNQQPSQQPNQQPPQQPNQQPQQPKQPQQRQQQQHQQHQQPQQQQQLQQQQQQHSQSGRGYRGDQNMGEANLHLSGYGPSTTNDDIISLFAPYVHVVEVVQKNGFCFVNTRDPDGAKRAREALNGTLMGGSPVRINIATRKVKNPTRSETSSTKSNSAGSNFSSLPRNNLGQVDFDQVRDDRGNPSTKNLFIAGYGPGTTEQQLREIVSQHATVISVVMKGSFAFVNTSDRDTAVLAREALAGFPVNGGALRINFAKESGRLGTSFDQTYGPASTSSYGRFR